MIVVAINVVLAAIAGTVNLRVAARVSAHRVLHVVVGCLAFGYACSYGWLLLNPEMRLEWSQVMSGVSVIAWPIVWTAPALATWRERRQITATLRAVEEVGG